MAKRNRILTTNLRASASKSKRKKDRLSPEGREAISRAAKRRWREYRRDNGLPAKSRRAAS